MRTALSIAIVLTGAVWLTPPATAADLPGSFIGKTHGVSINAAGAGVSDRAAGLVMSCLGTNGATLARQVGSYSNGQVAQTAALRTTAFGDKNARRAVARTTTEITALNLLDGLITAGEIVAVANATASATDIRLNSRGSRFSSLKVAGQPIPDDVAPHTRIDLAGIGSVVLNDARRSGNDQKADILVDMLRVDVTQTNVLGLPVGASIIVGSAAAGYNRKGVEGIAFGGHADTLLASVRPTHLKANAPSVGIPCAGTDGDVIAKQLAPIDLGTLLQADNGKVSAQTEAVNSDITATTTANLSGINLLNGFIRASAVAAVANDKLHGGIRISSTQGSRVTSLKVGGLPLGTIANANVTVDVPGYGTLIVNERTIPDPTSFRPTEMNALHLSILRDNPLGLPVGADVVVGHASTQLRQARGGAAQVAESGN
jgi:hypothetical protein